jgi:hypothetical protein
MMARMNVARVAAPVLDGEHAAFILLPGISMTAASSGPGNLPRVGRALGCRLSSERSRVTVLLAAGQCPELIAALRASCAIAVVFSQPSTHRTIQVKGTDAALEPLQADDAALVQRWTDGFVNELAALGYSEALVRAFLWCDPAELVAVGFTPRAAFQQTPGPRAGLPLGS